MLKINHDNISNVKISDKAHEVLDNERKINNLRKPLKGSGAGFLLTFLFLPIALCLCLELGDEDCVRACKKTAYVMSIVVGVCLLITSIALIIKFA